MHHLPLVTAAYRRKPAQQTQLLSKEFVDFDVNLTKIIKCHFLKTTITIYQPVHSVEQIHIVYSNRSMVRANVLLRATVVCTPRSATLGWLPFSFCHILCTPGSILFAAEMIYLSARKMDT